MEHPYDKVYLSDVIEEQGKFFERLQDAPVPIDSTDLITAYMHGYTRRQLDEGHAYYLTLDASRMKDVFLKDQEESVLLDDVTNLSHRSFVQRLWESLVRLLSPLL